jgi:hypothetical protein
MGRELKRVDLNFAWPLKKVWQGFLNPHYDECKSCTACESTGYSPFARHLYAQWYGNVAFRPEDNGCEPYTTDSPHVAQFADRQVALNPEFYGTGPNAILRNRRYIAGVWNRSWHYHLNQQDVDDLVAADALPWDFTRRPRTDEQRKPENLLPNGWLKEPNGYIPTIEEMGIYTCMSFGGSNMEYTLIKARCARAGEPEHCAVCNGEGSIWTSPEAKQTAEDWKETEPPVGDGYQIWETVSEGSPVSPVFATPEELAAWMAANDTSSSKGTSYESWLKWINGPGWSFSAVVQNGVFKDGVQAVVDRMEEQ